MRTLSAGILILTVFWLTGCAYSSAPAAPSPKALSKLVIEAGVVFESGAAQPVARNDFTLLDQDVIEILKNVPMPGKFKKRRLSPIYIYMFTKKCLGLGLQCTVFDDAWTFNHAANAAIASHSVKQGITGFDGKLVIEDIPAGTYYIYGLYLREDDYVVWNLKTDINRPEQTVILDQRNAQIAF